MPRLGHEGSASRRWGRYSFDACSASGESRTDGWIANSFLLHVSDESGFVAAIFEGNYKDPRRTSVAAYVAARVLASAASSIGEPVDEWCESALTASHRAIVEVQQTEASVRVHPDAGVELPRNLRGIGTSIAVAAGTAGRVCVGVIGECAVWRSRSSELEELTGPETLGRTSRTLDVLDPLHRGHFADLPARALGFSDPLGAVALASVDVESLGALVLASSSVWRRLEDVAEAPGEVPLSAHDLCELGRSAEPYLAATCAVIRAE